MSKKTDNTEKVSRLKVTLTDEDGKTKVVVLNKLTNQMERQAVKLAASRVKSGNQVELAMEGQHELFKMLIVSIDGKALTGNEREHYEDRFDGRFLEELANVVTQMRGKEVTSEIEFI